MTDLEPMRVVVVDDNPLITGDDIKERMREAIGLVEHLRLSGVEIVLASVLPCQVREEGLNCPAVPKSVCSERVESDAHHACG